MVQKLSDAARRDHIVRMVAGLHAASWKSAYRGIFSDKYLDHEVDAERLVHWEKRLPELAAGVGEIFLARIAGKPAGFVCIEIGPDREWGALVDNLHVLPKHRGGHIGIQLLSRAEAWAARHGEVQLHLWVFDANLAARRFYQRERWREAERTVEPVPGGGERIVWRLIKRL